MIGDELVISSRVQDLAELMPSTSNNLDDLDMDYSSIGRGASAGRQGDSSPSQIGDDNDHAMQQLRRRSCGEASSSSSSTNTTTRRRTSSRQSPIIHPEGEALRTSRNSSAWRQNERRRPTSTSPRWERGQPSSDASSNARALTRLITNCSRTADLYSLWTKEQGNFNRFHVAAMFSCLAKVRRETNVSSTRSFRWSWQHCHYKTVFFTCDRPLTCCIPPMLLRCDPCCLILTRPLSPTSTSIPLGRSQQPYGPGGIWRMCLTERHGPTSAMPCSYLQLVLYLLQM